MCLFPFVVARSNDEENHNKLDPWLRRRRPRFRQKNSQPSFDRKTTGIVTVHSDSSDFHVCDQRFDKP